MKRCPHCNSHNIKYRRARISRAKKQTSVVAVYYCYDCQKKSEIRQKIAMLPGFDMEIA